MRLPRAVHPFVSITTLWAVLLAFGAGRAGAQGQAVPRAIHGVTRDSSTGQALAGALVDLRSADTRRAVRTDEEGLFRISGLTTGRYQVSVLRIGYRERSFELEVSARDTALVFSMTPIPQQLSAFRVRGDVNAIYGMVASLPDLKPIPGTRVQLIGGDKSAVTDSAGGFFIATKDPGQYMVRMTREGYAERLFPIEIPRGRAVDASRMLDPGQAPAPGVDVLFKDFDNRLRQRATASSALVPGSEIRKASSNFVDGLLSAPSFSAHGMRMADTVCVFVNGIPRPGVSLDQFIPEEIESVEAYARTAGMGARSSVPTDIPTGDRSRNLSNAWPLRAPCGVVSSRSVLPLGDADVGPIRSGRLRYVVIWLKK
jgi:hypothetical protein